VVDGVVLHDAIAVIVHVVAGLRGARMYGRVEVIAVDGNGTAIAVGIDQEGVLGRGRVPEVGRATRHAGADEEKDEREGKA